MKKAQLTKLIAKKFEISKRYSNGRISSLSSDSGGVSVEHITDDVVVELKERKYSSSLNKMLTQRELVEIPTGKVKVEIISRTMGSDNSDKEDIKEVYNYLKENNVNCKMVKDDSDIIIVSNIEVKIPDRVGKIITQ